MHIEWLQAKNVRNLTDISIEPSTRLNVIIGPNASGKTSLLEAIHFLSRGRSFRTPRINEVIQWQQSVLLVTARIKRDQADTVITGLEKGHGKTVIKYNGEVINRISEQARNLPLILINPDSHNIITSDPKQRRHWLDWAMFHVEPAYLDNWRDYHRSLRHRNSLLRKGISDNKEFLGWERSMASCAQQITGLREIFIGQIQTGLERLGHVLQLPDAAVLYKQGWPDEEPLAECLRSGREADFKAGYSRLGVHRADLEFTAAGRPIATVCSRGEIKQFVMLLSAAQGSVFEQRTGEKPVFLVDDYSSELDTAAKDRVFSLLLEQESQVFLTTTDRHRDMWTEKAAVLFHVEQGKPMKMVE